jgi:hypothetical protein
MPLVYIVPRYCSSVRLAIQTDQEPAKAQMFIVAIPSRSFLIGT